MRYPYLVCLFATCWQVYGNDATWTGAVSSDLVNTPDNWSPSGSPSGIATFDSSYPSVQLSPTADAQFTVDSWYFPNSASAFQFTITDTSLDFTGLGIAGANTNTQITFINTTVLGFPQLYLDTMDSSAVSFGAANFTFTNGATGTIQFSASGNGAQLSLGDADYGDVFPVTAGDNVRIAVTNYGTVIGSNEAGQVFLKGSTYTAGDQYFFNGVNSGAYTIINSDSDTGQIVFDAHGNTANFTVGNSATFNLSNINGASIASTLGRGNNAAQILFDARLGTAVFTLGDSATITLTNDDGAISTITTGNDVGQMVFDGDRGTASFSAGNDASLTLYNQNGSSLDGLGFDTAQIEVDGDSGVASFSVGSNSTLVLVNDATSSIATGSDGNDAGQIIVDGNSGSASFTLGNQSTVSATNSGSISSIAGAYAAQILFDGSEGTVSLTTGAGVTITATNSDGATIANTGANPAAQMYFSSAAISGNPTLIAINQNPTIGSIQGIVFDGTSTANDVNIELQNTSLVVDTTSAPFTIASLTGDSTSVVDLYENFVVATVSGADTVFAGVISDIVGSNSLTISGSGTQTLSGANTFGGSTTVSGDATLVLSGSVLNNIVVEGGTLSGTGSMSGNLSVDSGATVSPQIGSGSTLSVGGTLTLDAGAISNFEINQSGENSKLAVTGAATLAGTVNVTQDPGLEYPRSAQYTILTGASLSDAFSLPVTGGLPGFPFTLSYADPTVYLSYAVPDIATSSLSGNALKVADYLNAYGSGSAVALFGGLSGSELSSALNSASPSRNAFVPYIAQQTSFALSVFLSSHIDLLRFSAETTQQNAQMAELLSDASDEIARLDCSVKSCQRKMANRKSAFSIWASGFGEYAHMSAAMQNPSFHFISGAALGGFDYKGANRALIGGALGYAHTYFNEAHDAGSGSINYYFANIYGNVFIRDFYLSPSVWGLFNQARNTRHVLFPGFSEKAKAHIYSWQFVPHLEIGYDCKLSWGAIVPFSSLDWAITWQRGYSEQGAAPFNATAKSHTSSMARSETGLKFCEQWNFSWGTFFLREKASYVFQKPFGTGTVTTALTGIPSSFTVTAVNQNLNLGAAAIDFLFAIGQRYPVSIDLGYEGEFGSNYWSNQLMLTLKKDF